MTTSQRGAMNELVAAADLLRRGYAVFRAVDSASCDLIALEDGRCYRVEVRSAHLNMGKYWQCPQGNPENYDWLAVVMPDGVVHYCPPLPGDEPLIEFHGSASFRLVVVAGAEETG